MVGKLMGRAVILFGDPSPFNIEVFIFNSYFAIKGG
jgi:hypothetical protein